MCYCMSIHSFPFLFFCPQHTVYCVVVKGEVVFRYGRCWVVSLRERENEFDNDNYMGIAKEIMIGYIVYTKSILESIFLIKYTCSTPEQHFF